MINETNIPAITVRLDSQYSKVNNLSNGSATFEILESISLNDQQYINIRVKYLEMPHVFKNITNNNNLFAFRLNGVDDVAAIPPDNYDVLELIEELQERTHITMRYNEQANKIQFTAWTPFTIKAISSCLDLLGLSKIDHVGVCNAVNLYYEVESTGFVNLSGLNHFYVSSNITTKNLGINGQRSNVLDVIPIGVPFGNMIIYNNNGGHYNMIYDKCINKFEIKFSDRYDQALNLENSYFLIILEIKTTNHKKIEYEDFRLSSLDKIAAIIEDKKEEQ